MAEAYSPPLDPLIANQVQILRDAGVETFESCQGGDGHAYPEPTVRFHGDQSEGFRALAVAIKNGLRVAALRRARANGTLLTSRWCGLSYCETTRHAQLLSGHLNRSTSKLPGRWLKKRDARVIALAAHFGLLGKLYLAGRRCINPGRGCRVGRDIAYLISAEQSVVR